MKQYQKPIVVVNDEFSEGVYAASGSTGDSNNTSDGKKAKCDSKYMNGVWQEPDYSDWKGGTRGYKQQFGCLGCPANTANGCGLETHYVESGNAASYDTDNGNRKPSWEKKGYEPDDTVTDWAM